MAIPTASESIGKQLMEGRVRKGLTVEDVAFKTHIPLSKVMELENDDFSNFANLTYAKSFVKLYGNFLDIDISDYLTEFCTGDMANVSGHEFIQSNNAGISEMSYAAAPDPNRGRWKGIALLATLIALIGGTVYFSKYWMPHEPAQEAKKPPAPATPPDAADPPGPKLAAADSPAKRLESPEAPVPVPPPVPPPATDQPPVKPPRARPILPAIPVGEESPAEATPKPESATRPGAIEVKPAVSVDENA